MPLWAVNGGGGAFLISRIRRSRAMLDEVVLVLVDNAGCPTERVAGRWNKRSKSAAVNSSEYKL